MTQIFNFEELKTIGKSQWIKTIWKKIIIVLKDKKSVKITSFKDNFTYYQN